jgi:FMN phosphatase YigB (HAD superfamily)
MTSKKWVLFDIGGVLEVVDDDAWQQEWWDRWQVASGLDRGVFDARIAAAHLPAIDVTTGTESDFWDAVSTALNLDDAQRSAMRADFWDAYCGTANGELIEYARTLSSRGNRDPLQLGRWRARGGGTPLRVLRDLRSDLLQPRAGRQQAGT